MGCSRFELSDGGQRQFLNNNYRPEQNKRGAPEGTPLITLRMEKLRPAITGLLQRQLTDTVTRGASNRVRNRGKDGRHGRFAQARRAVVGLHPEDFDVRRGDLQPGQWERIEVALLDAAVDQR